MLSDEVRRLEERVKELEAELRGKRGFAFENAIVTIKDVNLALNASLGPCSKVYPCQKCGKPVTAGLICFFCKDVEPYNDADGENVVPESWRFGE